MRPKADRLHGGGMKKCFTNEWRRIVAGEAAVAESCFCMLLSDKNRRNQSRVCVGLVKAFGWTT